MKGFDTFFPLPDVVDEMECLVCGANCDVTRSVDGPTGFGEAMAQKKHLHDEFRCPNIKKDWHKQAVNLIEELDRCHSSSLIKIMQNDLEEIVKEGIKE